MFPTGMRPEPIADEATQEPRTWARVQERYASVAAAYDEFGAVSRCSGPLDERAVAIAKRAVSIGAHITRTVHVHAKKAVAAGVSPDELRQVALVALPTIGLPRALDALQWIEESIEETA